MKLATRIFVLAYAALILGLGIGGTVLLQNAFGSMVQDRQQSVIARNQSVHYTLGMLFAADRYLSTTLAGQFERTLGAGERVEKINRTGWDVSAEELVCKTEQRDNACYCIAVSVLTDSDGTQYYITTEEEISDIYALRHKSYLFFTLFSCSLSLLGGIIIAFSVRSIARPITKLAALEKKFGAGDLTLRAPEAAGVWEAQNLARSFNDMAEQIERQIAELKEENRRREQFVGSFTHEIKTPITGIMGYADLMRSYELPPEERHLYCDTIYRESRRIEKLSLTLLELLGLKQELPVLEPFHTAQLAASLKISLQPVFEQDETSFQLDIQPDTLVGNIGLLHTLLFNLADNGRKAMNDRPGILRIEGKADEDGTRYIFKVIDTGRGIPQEELENITEPFYMVDKSRARKQGGAGLGLALCKRIAQLHHTDLVFESVLQSGTTVSFQIMRAESKEAER